MKEVKKPKEQNNTLFFASIALVFAAIVVTAVINNFSSEDTIADLRAKAGFDSSLKLGGIVASVDTTQGVVIVEDVHFVYKNRENSDNNLGVWTVTPPPDVALTSLTPGSFVEMNVQASSFLATTHTMTAAKIEVK